MEVGVVIVIVLGVEMLVLVMVAFSGDSAAITVVMSWWR